MTELQEDPNDQFREEVVARVETYAQKPHLQAAGLDFVSATAGEQYSYNFRWMDRPVIQYPQDLVAMQELIWTVQPELIVETGIAHGGSLIYYASILELLEISGHNSGRVLGIDVDIRAHNRREIERHPMYRRIDMIEGSSLDPDVIGAVHKAAAGCSPVMVILDSNHTHEHVLAELEAYAPLTTVGSYCVVFDTVVEDLPAGYLGDRPWGPGNNPKTAAWEFLESNAQFEIDRSIQDRLLITVAPDGYLQRVS